mmetsp:Transcript_9064/g.27132  ORF Transcript_9064/g.27132 Transcript_9064/m.27132 type:complete len:246 (-) Transcript_9064:80-817(-)
MTHTRAVAVALVLAAATAYAPRSRRTRTAPLRAKDYDVTEESADFSRVSRVFIDSFWADKAAEGSLTEAQKKELRAGQLDDFRRRYKLRRDTRRKAALFVAKDGDEILGCAGVELDGAADDTNLVPVMSNLATTRASRRRGVATALVRATEKRAREWGCGEMDLVVEQRNKPARALYSKLGYRVVDKNEDAEALVPTADGRISSVGTTTLTMRADLSGGAGGLLVPVLGGLALAAGVAASGVLGG